MDDQPLVTLSELARRAQVSGPRVLQLFQAGVLGEPDFRATSGSILFKPSRVAGLVDKIKNYGLEKAIRHNSARSK